MTDPNPPTPPITLVLNKVYIDRGKKKVEMSWTGTSASNVDIYVDGDFAKKTKNKGTVKFEIKKSGTVFVLKIREQGTNICSNEVTADYGNIPFTLTLKKASVRKGLLEIEFLRAGANSTNVDVFVDGAFNKTTKNDGKE